MNKWVTRKAWICLLYQVLPRNHHQHQDHLSDQEAMMGCLSLCSENAAESPGELDDEVSRTSVTLPEEGGQLGSVGTKPFPPHKDPASVRQLPCRASTGRFFATFFPSDSFLSPTPSGSDRDGEARPSGAVGRPGREMGLDSDSAWEAWLHLPVSKDQLEQHRQWPFMEVRTMYFWTFW